MDYRFTSSTEDTFKFHFQQIRTTKDMINAEGRMVAKLTPLRIDFPFPAGKDSSKNPDIYRSGIVISSAPLLKSAPGAHWNLLDSRTFSACPDPIIGVPFDTSKPRKGRWGETVNTTIYRDSLEVDKYWIDYHAGTYRWRREDLSKQDAKRDLQKRIEICLYGEPRSYDILKNCDSLERQT
ncbi:hypothetical protein Bpfe_021292 [Biomphalaria pfeifferi]|uniref:Uncharacterized protein n=1 Tax=Biomphalaria pfeifferi TaxID=112525 RepID=A0AAD8B772_BIOPF|nr:hypothetical protein Bpfe_021292 [Biomphalaria pfeifferi]